MQRLAVVAGLLSCASIAQPVTDITSRRWRVESKDTLTTGKGENQLGVTRIGEERPRAANAIALSGKTVWVVDGENDRMVKLEPKVVKRTTLPMPNARALVDLVPMGDSMVGFNAASSKLMRIDRLGVTHEFAMKPVTSFSALVPVGPRTLLLKSASNLTQLELDDPPPPPPPPPGPGPVLRPRPMMNLKTMNVLNKRLRGAPVASNQSIDVKLAAGKARIAFLKDEREEKAVEFTPPIEGRLVSTTLLGTDTKGRSYFRLEVLTKEEPITIERFIRVLDSAGAVLDDISIPTDKVIVPEKDIAVGSDGTIAVLLPYEDRTVVVRLAPP